MARLKVHESAVQTSTGADRNLLSIVGDPLFDEQETHRRFRNDPAVYEHLSPLRKNLFAWFDFPENGAILELGAGYGALTRYLASIPGSRVVAVEGSAARAQAIAARCRACDNVEIHACEPAAFAAEERFDAVVIAGSGAVRDVLPAARRLLADNGSALIAVDNRNGERYRAGAPHDRDDGAFDREELTALLRSHGCTTLFFTFPFPEYRQPEGIATTAAFSTRGFDPFSLLQLGPGRGSAADAANSFLVFASPSAEPWLRPDPGLLAVRLNSLRAAPFATRVVFFQNGSRISVRKERIGRAEDRDGPYEEFVVRHHPAIDNKDYFAGFTPLEERLIEGIAGAGVPAVERVLRQWLCLLEAQARPAEPGDAARFERFALSAVGRPLYTHVYGERWIDGACLDLIPRNILEDAAHSTTEIIDREWAFSLRVPLQLVFDRAFHHLRGSLASRPRAPGPLHGLFPVPPDALRPFAAHPLFRMHDRLSGTLFEGWFQNFVMSGKRSIREPAAFAAPPGMSGVTIVVPVFNKEEYTRDFIASLSRSLPDAFPCECIVVDNASTDATAALLREQCAAHAPWLRAITLPENRGYAGACAAGAARASHSHLLFMNNDMLLFPRWLEPLADAFRDDRVGIAGGRLVYPDFSIQHAGIVFRDDFTPIHPWRYFPFSANEVCASREFAAVTGACLMIPKKLFDDVGGFDLSYSMYFEDIDLCLKVVARDRAVVYIPECVVMHFEGKSSPSQEVVLRRNDESRPRFLQRWGAQLSRLLVERQELFQCGRPYCRPASSRYHDSAAGSAPRSAPSAAAMTTPRGFVTRIATLVEAGHLGPALEYYRGNRSLLTEKSGELEKVDLLMEQLREKTQPRPQQGKTSAPPFGFNVIGFISANLGLGAAARTTIRLLLENKYPVAAVEVDAGFGRAGSDRTFDHLKKTGPDPAPYAINLFHLNPPECGEVLKQKYPWANGPGRLNVIVPFWELPVVPPLWLETLKAMDLILAPTHFIEHVMATQVSGIPVRHYPQTVFLPDGIAPDRAAFGLPEQSVLFVTSFEMLSDINRKNAWAVIEAFGRAFAGNENTGLVVKVNNPRARPSLGGELEKLRALAARDSRVRILDTPLSYREVLTLYASCDVLVSLHRSEGLGLSPMEAMCLGKPVIATAWSGTMDFMDDHNSCPIPYTLVPVPKTSNSGYNEQYVGRPTVWAEPDVGSAVDWMRKLAADGALRERIGNAAAAGMRARHAECRRGEVFGHLRRFYENRVVLHVRHNRETALPRRGLRVLFQNRSNAFDLPGGDTVVMKRLKEHLERGGAAVDFCGDASIDTVKSYDIVHCFNLTLPAVTERFAKNAVAHNVPFCVTSLQEDFPRYYHKAVAAVSWFGAYVPADAARRAALPKLAQAFASAQPCPLVTSPFAGRAASLLFACGRTEASLLRSSFGHDRIAVAAFGSSIKDVPAPAALFEEAFGVRDFVLCVGRVEPRKNQLMLLYALEESGLSVVFADGGFTYQPDYLDLCKKYSRKGRTLYTGRLSDELLVSAYHACRTHCLPSWYELPGLVSIEAAAYGCPVVASSWGCLPDYLGSHCTWCEPDDPGSIRAAVESAPAREPCGSAAEAARSFTWEKFGSQTLQWYHRVLEEHSGFEPGLADEAARSLGGPDLPAFINQITTLVEQGNLAGALDFYKRNRRSIATSAPELGKVDELMGNLKKKLQRA